MKENLKKVLIAIVFVAFVVFLAIAVYNTFFRKDNKEENKPSLTTVDREDKSYKASEDPYSDQYIPEVPGDEINPDPVKPVESTYENSTVSCKIGSTEFSFGGISGEGVSGIVLNPTVSNDNVYVIIIGADKGEIDITSEEPHYFVEELDKKIYVKGIRDWLLYETDYKSIDDCGLVYYMDVGAEENSDCIRIRYLDIETLNLQYMINLYVEKVDGRLKLVSAENGNIFNYDSHMEIIENCITTSRSKYFDTAEYGAGLTMTDIFLCDTNGFYGATISESKNSELVSMNDIKRLNKPIKVATMNIENGNVCICLYITGIEKGDVIIGLDYINKYDIVREQLRKNLALCQLYSDKAAEYGLNPNGTDIIDFSIYEEEIAGEVTPEEPDINPEDNPEEIIEETPEPEIEPGGYIGHESSEEFSEDMFAEPWETQETEDNEGED